MFYNLKKLWLKISLNIIHNHFLIFIKLKIEKFKNILHKIKHITFEKRKLKYHFIVFNG
jgi:hypothetical protein